MSVWLPLESFGLLPLVVFMCFLILAFTKEDGDFKNGDGSLFSPSRPLRQRLAHDQPLRDSYDRRLLACSVKYRILILFDVSNLQCLLVFFLSRIIRKYVMHMNFKGSNAFLAFYEIFGK